MPCAFYTPFITSLLLVCRARGRPDQKRTETRCGMPGARGVNAPVPVEEEPRIPLDDASVPSKALHIAKRHLKAYYIHATHSGQQ